MRRFLVAISLVLTLSGGAFAQDSNYARRTIRALSAPEMWGRGASYRGDSVAANYIRAELRRLGVKDIAQSYYQRFSFNTCSMEGQCWIEINGRRLRNYEDFRVMPWSGALVKNDVSLVQIPAKTYFDHDKLDSYIAKHQGLISDAVVYIDFSELATGEKEDETMLNQALARLRKRNPFGSKGVMVGLPKLQTYSVSQCDRQQNYAYIEVLPLAIPKKASKISLCINTQYRPGYRTQNVWGMIEGESDSIFVLTAHYDHLGTMGDGYKWMKDGQLHQEGCIIFPGAHDNASGVAALLDVARIYSREKPRYTLVFIFFAGEESGLKGSTYAAENPLIDFSKVKLLLNIDMFCGGDEGLMVVNARSPETKPYYDRLKALNDVLQLAPTLGSRPNAAISDHYPFRNLCPAIYCYTMGQPYGGYHDPYDTCAGCSLAHYYNYLLLITSLLM